MRGIVGAIAGFLIMIIVIATGTAVLLTFLVVPRDGGPTPSYLAANIVLSFLAAFGAGSVATAIARAQANISVAILVVLLIISTVVSMLGSAAGEPAWYLTTTALAGIAGVVLGARVQGRRYR
jgi:hypothetical protein